nr:MAG TPA: hypothetical protein [Caudoviricetes sp.]
MSGCGGSPKVGIMELPEVKMRTHKTHLIQSPGRQCGSTPHRGARIWTQWNTTRA